MAPVLHPSLPFPVVIWFFSSAYKHVESICLLFPLDWPVTCFSQQNEEGRCASSEFTSPESLWLPLNLLECLITAMWKTSEQLAREPKREVLDYPRLAYNQPIFKTYERSKLKSTELPRGPQLDPGAWMSSFEKSNIARPNSILVRSKYLRQKVIGKFVTQQ